MTKQIRSATDCALLIINDCTLSGVFGDRELAVSLSGTRTAIFDTVISGGQGLKGIGGPVDGTPGGVGLKVVSGDVFLSGCSLSGGKGGKGAPFEVVWTLVSTTPSLSLPFGNNGGNFLLLPPFNLFFFGRVGGTGQLAYSSSPLAPFPPGVLPLHVFAQGVFDVPGGSLLVSGGRTMTILD